MLFGGKKLPEMMRGLGQGVKEFKKGVNDIETTVDGKEHIDREHVVSSAETQQDQHIDEISDNHNDSITDGGKA